MKDVFPVDKFDELGQKRNREKCPRAGLAIIAEIAREINDAEKAQMDIIRGASVLAPELKKLENEREQLRYEKQEETILRMVEEGSLKKNLLLTKLEQSYGHLRVAICTVCLSSNKSGLLRNMKNGWLTYW